VDLTPYAGADVEVSLTYASDDFNQSRGVFVDDIAAPGGAGSTSFEDDGDTLDGWTVAGAARRQPAERERLDRRDRRGRATDHRRER
jgi:hypothetical protein